MAASTLSGEEEWRISPCSGYGSIIRQMKAGRLAGGLLPLDIFASEFLSAHAPVQAWRILTLQAAQPRELVISNAARNLLKPTQQSSTLPFRIALDGLHSATRRAVEAWVKQNVPHIQARTSYKVLPFNTVHQGMETTMIEAFAGPAPWGLMAQHQDLGTLQADFHTLPAGDNAMALVIHSQHAVDVPAAMQRIQAALAHAHKQLSTPVGRASAIELLAAPAPCAFPPCVLEDAFAKTPPSSLPVPASIAKIASSLSRLVEGGVWRGNAMSNERLAQSLSVF
ncbi:MAG: hypothetical protein JWO08_591 [Verrucomicrobiaceae bacterium]|nr:hypothetical protein [Verrucomicrobiaceae bacterium]